MCQKRGCKLKDEKKQAIRQKIIDTAGRLFVNGGFADSTMEKLAKSSGMSRRSLYRYFENKDELIILLAVRHFEIWNSVQDEIFQNLSGNAAERLESFLRALVDYCDNNRDLLIFMAEFDHYFRSNEELITASVMKYRQTDYFKMLGFTEERVTKLLKQGIDEGLFIEIEPSEISILIDHVLWLMGQNSAKRWEMLEKEFHRDPVDLIHRQIDIYMQWLKNEK